MNDIYTELYEKKYLQPIKIDNKEEYYGIIDNLYSSITGRFIHYKPESTEFINNLITESVTMLSNSIRLFELGYFDCAYYSLRTSIELSTQTVYFTDMKKYENTNLKEEYDKGLKLFRKNMIRNLKETLNFTSEQMPNFFKEMEETMNEINSKVHKNGLINFYSCKEESLPENELKKEFIKNLKKSIKIVAIIRLFIDPLPILPENDEIYMEMIEIWEFGYSNTLLEIIGKDTIDEFKNTYIYESFYSTFKN